MIDAVIYDMDGLIIDSEPFWLKAEIETFGRVGVILSEEDCRETTGLRVDETVAHWQNKHSWTGMGSEEIVEEIFAAVLRMIASETVEKKGFRSSLEIFQRNGVKIALASSSPKKIINAVLDQLNATEYFEVIHSAEDEEYGKPHPGVYISTAQKLGVSPLRCVALEDSVNGVISAKAAKMRCIAVPDYENLSDKRYGIADHVLSSLEELTEDMVGV